MSKFKTSHAIFLLVLFISCMETQEQSKINRQELVSRHTVIHSNIDSLSCLTVGNGSFAFTADITGLQTFPDNYEDGIPLGTQSDWGWHSFPNPENYTQDDVVKYFKVGKNSVPYWYQFSPQEGERKSKATAWLRENPHRLHLGLLGLQILKKDSSECEISDLGDAKQTLNLWTGELLSKFKVEGVPVEVVTYCHQEQDAVSFKISSKLIKQSRIKVRLRFSYGAHDKFSPGYDFNANDKHTTQLVEKNESAMSFKRTFDEDSYFSNVKWNGKANVDSVHQHEYLIQPSSGQASFEMTCHFSKDKNEDEVPAFETTALSSKNGLKTFWESGAAVDFSACTDPRAKELERRVVLSQYLTKIQCTGKYPPQETGLTYNSWHGKFHLEMHWWHALHFILWNRADLVEKQLDFYNTIEDRAKKTSEFQGYKGVRWPKMIDPSGKESPSSIGAFLIWQQPHFIYFSELLRQSSDNKKELVEKYKDLVFATTEFMASYARWDSSKNKYVLGPALIPAQERFHPETTINPAFELAYWHWGLKTAQKWRVEAGMEPDEKWQHVIDNLSSLPVQDSLYLFTEDAKDSYTNPHYLTDHPMVLGLLGFLPPMDFVDRQIMQNTQEKVKEAWNWETIWGWDIPLAAMNATFLDKPGQAIDFLMMDTPKNTYLVNGHNWQRENLTVYLPGNGGFLLAIALMCTYKNKDGKNGFPDDGKWDVKYEGLNNWIKNE